MSTPLGNLLRHMRIERDEILLDMANRLNINVVQLSKIEREGDMPDDLVEKLKKVYSPSESLAQSIDGTIRIRRLELREGMPFLKYISNLPNEEEQA